ncbi:MAG: molecular chaperone DnaK [Steroidobacteraceae bacterium]|nr:molecular chaperone DnaK [Steroidobacteraceae bacterium]
MSVKKPSAKPSKPAKKTVSAKVAKPAAPKAAVRPAPKAAARDKTAIARKPVVERPAVSRPVTNLAAAEREPRDRLDAAAVVDAARADEPEFEMSASLLSGPRNVQPYQIRKGEEYMSKEQLEHFRRILASWKQDLMQEVDRTVLHMKDEAANFPDPNDRATQESEFSLELRTRDRERKLIRKIDEALKRIEDGSYGYCLETGEPIGVKRLEARPVATLSVEAQERRERREKQFGDRDDWYR